MKTNRPTSRLPAHQPTRLPWCALLLAFVCSISLTASAATNELTTLLQKGLFEEEANHNLEAAKNAYELVVTQFDKDRKLAATAVFRLGEVLRKQGKTNEANAQYERVVREFSDQKQLVDLAGKISGARLEKTRSGSKDLIALAKDFQWQTVSLNAEIWQTEYEMENLRKQRVVQTDAQKLKNIDQRLEELEAKKARLERKFEDQLQAFSKLHGLTQEETLAVRFGYSEKGRAGEASTATKTGAVNFAESNQTTTSAEAEEIRRIQALIKNSPDLINARNTNGFTPVQEAANKGQLTVAEFLLENGADANPAGTSPLWLAASQGHRAMVELLIKHGVDAKESDAIAVAASKSYRSVVETLLKHGANPNKGDGLHKVVANGNLEMVKMLVAAGADVNVPNQDSSFAPHRRGQGMYNEVTVTGLTPLHRAAIKGDVAVAAFLLDHGAKINVQDSMGYPPLYEAIRLGYVPMIDLLLQRGASVDVSSAGGLTALHVAVVGRNPEIVQSVLSYKPNLEAKAESLGTALQMNWSPEIADQLLKAGANPNVQNKDGNTPLHRAVEARNKALLEVLLKAKADPNLPNGKNQTPLDLASWLRTQELGSRVMPVREQKEPQASLLELAQLLIRYGADENRSRRERISVTRTHKEIFTPFVKGTNFVNEFTVSELLMRIYGHQDWHKQLPWPDFSEVKIHRLNAKTSRTNVVLVDVEKILAGGNPSKDVFLQWGDIVEIPEREHTLGAEWQGLSKEELEAFDKLLQRQVTIVVKGKSAAVQLLPKNEYHPQGYKRLASDADGARVIPGFWLEPVLKDSKLLLSSSDTERIAVKRRDGSTVKVNLMKDLPYDLWLRDGDVIEIPERDPKSALVQ